MSEASTAIVAADRVVPAEYVGKLEPNYYCRSWNGKRLKYCRSRAGAGTDHPGSGRCRQHDGGGSGRLTHGQSRRYADIKSPRLSDLLERYSTDPDPYNIRQELDLARALMMDWVERYQLFVAQLTAWHDSWEGKYVPLLETEAKALVRVLDEYEAMLAEEEATAKQQADLQSARTAVAFLSIPRETKPRQVLDVSDAMSHVDTISKVIHRFEQVRQRGSISIERIRLFMLGIDRVLELEVDDVELRKRIRKGINGVNV